MTKISAVLGNSQKLDGGAMFGNAPRTVWEKWIPPDELGRIPLACRALLIEHEGSRILCETGIGAFFEPKLAERFGVQNPSHHVLLENLMRLDLGPDDIDYVILSHLHFDHAGGLLPTYAEIQKGNDDLVFSKAQFITSATAMARAKHPHSRDRASFIPELTEKLEKSGRLSLIPDDCGVTLFNDRLKFFISNGHTPGHLHTVFQGDQETLVFCGDLIPGVPWVHVPITMGYDRYPEMLIDEKTSLYQNADLAKWNFFFTHDSKVCMSKVKRDEKGKYSATHEVEFLQRFPL